MVAATVACMAHSASLTEISKRDIWSPQRMAQERPDLQYKLVAIDFLPPKVSSTVGWHLPDFYVNACFLSRILLHVLAWILLSAGCCCCLDCITSGSQLPVLMRYQAIAQMETCQLVTH